MILMISGYRQNGKDTFYNAIRSNATESEWVGRVSFADTLKDEYKNKTGIDFLNLSGSKKDSERPGLINYAEEKRAIDKDIWVKKAIQFFNKENGFSFETAVIDTTLVITDFRYPNEYGYLRRKFPNTRIETIRIVRPELEKPSEDCRSEFYLDDFKFDHYIINVDLQNYIKTCQYYYKHVILGR